MDRWRRYQRHSCDTVDTKLLWYTDDSATIHMLGSESEYRVNDGAHLIPQTRTLVILRAGTMTRNSSVRTGRKLKKS